MRGAADGVGASATFNEPYALVQRADGKLVVTDWSNHKLRIVGLDGTVTSIGAGPGFADGPLPSAKINHPQGIVKAANGELYITDIDIFRVRKISEDMTSITTIAGDGTPGYKDDDNKAAAQFYGLEGLSVKPDGSAVFARRRYARRRPPVQPHPRPGRSRPTPMPGGACAFR